MNRKKFRLTKIFHFEMAHALHHYQGLCRNIHGHSYQLDVTIKGEISTEKNSSTVGMVMDFSELKKIVQDFIINQFDHSLVLNVATCKKRAAFNYVAIKVSEMQKCCFNINKTTI